MYEKILAPLDGSKEAEYALCYVEMIAAKFHSEVTLLNATTMGNLMERPWRAYLEKNVEWLQSLGIEAFPIVVRDFPANAVLNFAHNNNIGLIVLCAHTQSGARQWALGDVARKVLYATYVPVLLVKPTAQAVSQVQLRKVLVPLDGSLYSEASLPYVKQLVEGSEAEVMFLRVANSPTTPVDRPELSWEEYRKVLMEDAHRQNLKYLEEVRNRFDGGEKVTTHALQGNAAQIIVRFARDNNVDLIAMTTHGSTSIARWVYGSVANRVVEETLQPVILIRPDTVSMEEARA